MMVFSYMPTGVSGHALPRPGLLLLAVLAISLFCTTTARAASPPNTVSAGAIPSVTASVHERHQYVINGSFRGDGLTYSATLEGQSSLPDWISLDKDSGVFEIEAPAFAMGNQYKVLVTTMDIRMATATSSFYINIVYSGPGCTADANTDRLGKILGCETGTVKLRGLTSSGIYEWRGPNGFFSSEKEPVVAQAGLYVLTGGGDVACPRRSIVEVKPSRPDCKGKPLRNRIPVGEILSTRSEGVTELTVQFDALESEDVDGSVVAYHWAWEGGSASGARPRITFAEGDHSLLLTVMDDTGAKSTSEHIVTVEAKVMQHTFWLEAECAQVGDTWSVVGSATAAGGSYVAPRLSSMSSAPADAPNNYVRFTLKDSEAGDYTLNARISAADNGHDSYWVRANGGAWMAWNSGLRKGGGFHWNRNATLLKLMKGVNTIDFAFREADTRLDKLMITRLDVAPAGTGPTGSNCTIISPPVASATASVLTGTGITPITLNATDSYDRDGSIVAYSWAWKGGTASGALPRPLFEVGEHEVILTVIDDDGLRGTDTLSLSISAPVEVIVEETEIEETEVEEEENNEETIVASATRLWLEAECAAVGSRWETVSDPTAAGENYVVVKEGNAMGSAPDDTEANRVRFTANVDSAGSYHLFARIEALTNLDDSYYVRINGGSWFKWNSGIRQGAGFTWNEYPEALHLMKGSNTIDFTYREDDTRLDKLYLTPGTDTPTGTGPRGANCAPKARGLYADEAECARVGSGWQSVTSSEASGNSYLVFGGDRSTARAAGGDAEQLVEFDVDARQDGDHYLYFRINAPDPGRNSLWVRVDQGGWIKFWEEIGGRQLMTDGFEWREVTDDGERIALRLTAGRHTVTVANREPGTMLDKIFLSDEEAKPRGMGPEANNCRVVTTRTAMGSMMGATVAGSVEEDPEGEANVFPNPAGNFLHLSLMSDYKGPVSLIVSDLNGRRVSVRNIDKRNRHLSSRFDTADLPAGMYYLRIYEAEKLTVKPFVKR